MQLTHLSLIQFRNYIEAEFSFQERVVGISGRNGMGKTNLLDAIHYLCFTRSYFSRTDAASVRTGFQGFRIQGFLRQNGHEHNISCILRESGKKEFCVNNEQLNRFSSHIGRYPVVFIAPDDIALVSEGAEARRRFLDALLCQIDDVYLQDLIKYQKVLLERNSFLKKSTEFGQFDVALLDVLDQQLAAPAVRIHKARKSFLVDFLPKVLKQYGLIAGMQEELNLVYLSGLEEINYLQKLRDLRARDLAAMRTLSGIHKDDIDISLHGLSFRQSASQGQRKSLLFALKFAEYEALRLAKGFSPILLLDDIFEKLDAVRMENLLQWVCKENNGQVFLTDTHADRISAVMQGIGVNCQPLELKG